MAYTFIKEQYFIVPETADEPVPLGSIQADENFELSDIMVRCQKVGTHTTEELSLELHGSQDRDFPLYTSTVYTYDDFGMDSSHWAGQIRFSFDRVPISKELTYYVKLVAGNYTYAADKYVGVEIDFPEKINTNASDTRLPAAMGIYGYFDY